MPSFLHSPPDRYLPRALNALIVASTLVAFYVGFRMPSLWSLNYFLPSVFEGFYRRSLPGSILYVLGDLRFSYYAIVVVQALIFTASIGTFLYVTLKAANQLKVLTILFL